MSELVKQFESLMMNVTDRQSLSKDDYITEAKKRAELQEEILRQFKDEDWNILFSSPYPVQAKIAFKHWKERIERERKKGV